MYGDIIGVVVGTMKILGIRWFKILKQWESLISPTCNIETKVSAGITKGDSVGSKLGSRLMKLHQVKEILQILNSLLLDLRWGFS